MSSTTKRCKKWSIRQRQTRHRQSAYSMPSKYREREPNVRTNDALGTRTPESCHSCTVSGTQTQNKQHTSQSMPRKSPRGVGYLLPPQYHPQTLLSHQNSESHHFPKTSLTALSPNRTSHAPLLRHINRLPTLLCFCRIAQSLLDIRCQTIEGLLNIDIALGRDLEEGNSQLICQLLSSFRRNRPFLLPVAFVADEDFLHSFGRVLLDV